METATKQVEAPAVDSDLSGNTSAVSSSLHGTGGRKENITRIDRYLYEAAAMGNFNDFTNVQNIENLLASNKNTVLHIHLTSQTTEKVSQQFVEQNIKNLLTPKKNRVLHIHLSGNISTVTSPSSSLHGTGERKENITRIDSKLYKAAVEGKFDDFDEVQNIENLLTPNKNTVLHIHLTSASQHPSETTRSISTPNLGLAMEKLFGLSMKFRTTRSVSQQFVEQILGKCGGLVRQPNAKGETPLHMAARYGHSSIAKLLIERAKRFSQDIENGIGEEKKLIRATNCEKNTALHEAVRYDHIKVVEILLEMDPDHAYSANNANETPLYLASERQYKVMVNKMLEVLKSPAYDGPNGQTALHAAVINGDIGTAEYLLKNKHLKAAVKHADKKGWVPLHYAVKIGNKDLIELLLKQDENTAYMQDNEGRTALHIAACCGHWVIMEMIIKWYPDCSELVDNKGCNALHYALEGHDFDRQTKIMSNLSLSNLYNEKDVNGNTPLHHLATSSSTNTRFVWNDRVDKHARNKEDQTTLDVAYANPNDTDILINQGIINDLKFAGARRSGQDLYLNSEAKQEKSQQLMNSAKEGESSLIVATLIATVSFAAGITLPGGTIQEGKHQGSPILGERASFKAFIVSNTIALVLSASAAFIRLFSPDEQPSFPHLSSSTYKLLSLTAFTFTLSAVSAMIVAFSTATYAVLGPSPVGIAVLIIGLSFFPVYWDVIGRMKNILPILFKSILKYVIEGVKEKRKRNRNRNPFSLTQTYRQMERLFTI